MEVDCCIVGAGFAGLRLARQLEEQGASYIVLDKGRSPGGRAATRRMAGTRFDHGLPWLEDRGRFTAGLIDSLRDSGLIQPVKLNEAGERAWVSPGGITAVTKHLASGMKVEHQRKVASVAPAASGSSLILEENAPADRLTARHVVVTAPIPQAAQLVPELFADVVTPTGDEAFRKSVIALVATDSGQDPGQPFLFDNPVPGIERITVESQKRESSVAAFTVRSDETASETLWDLPDDEIWSWISSQLTAGGFDFGTPGELQIKKWRYSECAQPIGEPFLSIDRGAGRLSACGDGFSVPGCTPGLETSLGSAEAFGSLYLS